MKPLEIKACPREDTRRSMEKDHLVVDAELPPDESLGYAEYQQKVQGTNVSSQTLLATDYLNHFNEIVMLLDMLPDMPDMVEDCKTWEPKSYKEHFADSTFSDKQLAIEAYDRVPQRYLRPFEETVRQLNVVITEGVVALAYKIEQGAPEDDLRDTCLTLSRTAQVLMDCASSIIHGSDHAMAQSEIDGLLRR